MIGVFLAVGLGGFCGGMARWALSRWPGGLRGTLVANIIAAAIMGFALGLPGLIPLAVGTGFAGALSTWSTLARELGSLLKAGHWRRLTMYAAATLILGVTAAWFSLRVF